MTNTGNEGTLLRRRLLNKRTPAEPEALNRYFSSLLSGKKSNADDTEVVERLVASHFLEAAAKLKRISKLRRLAGHEQ